VSDAAQAERPRPGRPSTGARERILEAALETLKAEGYAGLTTAKVAARAGESKALIAYHFGSKRGLVAAAASEVADEITREVVGGIGHPGSVEEVARGALEGVWRVLERDERLARLYFDLAAVSVVEDDIRTVMRELKERWQAIVERLLREADASLTPARARAAAVLIRASVEGFALERIDRGDSTELRKATELFVGALPAAVIP
jgi:AcrR family transcriptional regulator